jgi:hypothetical protein
MRDKTRNEIEEMIESYIEDHINAKHRQNPIGCVYMGVIRKLFWSDSYCHPQDERVTTKQWVDFYKKDDEANGYIKINGVWFRKEDVIIYETYYETQYQEKRKKIEKRLSMPSKD